MLDPIVTVLKQNIEAEIIGETLKVSQKIGVHVNEERLRQALYDAHSFYNEGYRHGRKDAAQPWISVKERLPEQSGQVVAMTLSFDGERVNCVMNMYYSAKHKAFNVFDDDSAARVRKTEIHPAFWMPMPNVPEEPSL